MSAKATGSVDGVQFERDMDNGFGYHPAHARMVSVQTPELIRGSDGLIDEIRVEIDVESVIDDRLGVNGTLVFRGSDGTERSVGSAQTSMDVKAGRTVMKLRFESNVIALALASGPYYLRDLSLVSHRFAVTQHRLGRGLDLATVTLASTNLRYPTTFSPAVEELFEQGALNRK